jgi:hypothetical protein
MTHKTEYRDPKTLKLHKLRKHFPAVNKKSADYIAVNQSVHATGILQPLLITAEGFIADGGWRWEAAMDWQMTEVPCRVIPENLVGVVIAESLMSRKQMTRGAGIYLLIPIFRDIITSAEHRRLANVGRNTGEIDLKPQCFSKGSNSPSDETPTIQDTCKRLGVDKKTFRQARLVWNLLNDTDCTDLKGFFDAAGRKAPALQQLQKLQQDFKAELEPLLLNGEKNLWNVVSSIGGSLIGGEHELPQKQLELFGDALDSLATRAERFDSDNKVSNEIRAWLQNLEHQMVEQKNKSPEEFREKLASMFRATKIAADTMAVRLKEIEKAGKNQTA